MLRRCRRVTYRALKLQFHLDDETLEVLKDELVYGQQLAADEEGRVLVWAGAPVTPPAAGAPQVVTLVDHSDPAPPAADVPVGAAVHVRPVPNAERRQLTVLFCDVVGST
jgi:class 3 adenylate cyclase